VKHLIPALLAATFSLSVTAATNLNSSRSNVQDFERATTVKGSKSNSDNRTTNCEFTIDQKGAKRQATAAEKQKCEAGIAVSDPGVPNDKNTSKK
jgi:hypothetical protein